MLNSAKESSEERKKSAKFCLKLRVIVIDFQIKIRKCDDDDDDSREWHRFSFSLFFVVFLASLRNAVGKRRVACDHQSACKVRGFQRKE